MLNAQSSSENHKVRPLFHARLVVLLLFTFLLPGFSFAEGQQPGSALVVIDMQEPFITRGGHAGDPENVKKVDAIIKAQVAAIEIARRKGIPIIFLEYENYGPTNATLRKAVEGYATTATFQKTADGMLETWNSHRAELQAYLDKNKVKTMVVTGANGGACVQASIEGALRGNYNVFAVSNGIADFNYTEFIYPYSHHYDGIKPDCQSCAMHEVENAAEAFGETAPEDKGTIAVPVPCPQPAGEMVDPKLKNTINKINQKKNAI